VSVTWEERCLVCEERPGSVVLDTPDGETLVCAKCSRFLEQFAKLYGLPTVRTRMALRVVR
jgi:hypothetical protein